MQEGCSDFLNSIIYEKSGYNRIKDFNFRSFPEEMYVLNIRGFQETN